MGNRLTPIVQNLLIINVVVFLLDALTPNFSIIINFGLRNFSSDLFQPYQLVTYMFIHFDFRHILFNMLALFFFGPWMENVLGSQRFFIFYMVAGLGAGVINSVVNDMVLDQMTLTAGASGSISAVLIAFALIFPNVKVMLLIPPIPIKAKYLAMIMVAYDLYSGIQYGTTSGVAHFAHLSGALIGFIMIKYWGIKRQY